jgi:hypothetical protein
MLENAKSRLRNDSAERTRVERTMNQMYMTPSEQQSMEIAAAALAMESIYKYFALWVITSYTSYIRICLFACVLLVTAYAHAMPSAVGRLAYLVSRISIPPPMPPAPSWPAARSEARGARGRGIGHRPPPGSWVQCEELGWAGHGPGGPTWPLGRWVRWPVTPTGTGTGAGSSAPPPYRRLPTGG